MISFFLADSVIFAHKQFHNRGSLSFWGRVFAITNAAPTAVAVIAPVIKKKKKTFAG